ncbi:hypothetical protein [Chitinophaga sp. HK235]|uniref:hypothetical protein n=1 Tax=Chitinophaga sp. HK235 TaxID=2952571 RepID=UPI001BA555F8|nr:hypothetical protein [Chitinophaga sp. HK235]
MNEAINQSGFEFDKRLDSSLYITFEKNESYAIDIFEYYVTSIQMKLADLEDAILNRDVDRVDLLSHAHISTYNYVGLSFIAEIMREMRHRANIDDWSQVEYLMEQARIHTESVSPIINEELERLRLYCRKKLL